MAAAAAAAAGLGAAAAVEGAPAQPAPTFKVYFPGNPGLCVALVASRNCLVLRAANPADPEKLWEQNVLSDNSFELVNWNSGMSIINAHILPPILVGSAQFHPRLLCATARWEEGFADVGDGGIDIVCVSVMRNPYLALRIAPWGHDHQGNDEIGMMAGDEVAAVVVEAGAGAGAGAEAEAEAEAAEDAATTSTRASCLNRLRRLFPCLG